MERQLMVSTLENFAKQLNASGIRSLINYVWLLVKNGAQPLAWTKNLKHYESYSILTDRQTLLLLKRNIELSMNLLPARTGEFYNSQALNLTNAIKAYSKDPYHVKEGYISAAQKKGRLLRAQENVVLDHADESNFSKPAYYVLREGSQLTVVVRGTSNKSDKMIDIDFSTVQVDNFFLHSGFYWHAHIIFQELEIQNLLDTKYTYVTTGHSMGGAVAAILGYLLFSYFQRERRIAKPAVRSYGFGMACAGCIKFSEFCRLFCICIVNGFDMVPATSFHAMKVQQQRLLYENNLKHFREKDKAKRNEILKRLSAGEFVIQNARHGEKVDLERIQIFETLSENPTPKEISEKCTVDDDLFPAGVMLHYIKGKFFNISVHDISEITLSYPSFLDHFGYGQVAEDIGHMLGLFE